MFVIFTILQLGVLLPSQERPQPRFAEVEDIGGMCRRIAYSLKNHYSLAYLTEVGPGSEKARKIQVLTTGRDYLVYARRSYLPPKLRRSR